MDYQLLSSPEDALQYGSRLLRGEKIALRASVEDDLEALAKWWSLDDWAVLQQRVVKPRPQAALAEMFRGWSKNEGMDVGFSIVLEDGTLIGHTTLYGAALPTRIATLAIVIGPEYVDHGYGTDATRVMLRYAFRELGLNKVELQTWLFNARGIRAYEKAGFVQEGVRRAASFHNGRFHNEVLMGVLAEDWNGGR